MNTCNRGLGGLAIGGFCVTVANAGAFDEGAVKGDHASVTRRLRDLQP